MKRLLCEASVIYDRVASKYCRGYGYKTIRKRVQLHGRVYLELPDIGIASIAVGHQRALGHTLYDGYCKDSGAGIALYS